MASIEMAKKARAEQGPFETEVSFGGEADLHRHLIDCEKNPQHEEFIPVKKFSITHLPTQYQDENLFDCVKLHADLTVRVSASQTSLERPKTMPGTDLSYPFYNFRGIKCMRVGSGWVSRALEKVTQEENRPCPCVECSESTDPKKEWGTVLVYTAAHVVFNDGEARHTKCELYYDENGKRGNVRTLLGINVDKCDIKSDWSHVQCVTHDLELWDRLDKDCRKCWALQETVREKFFQARQLLKMVIVVSHPHGCSKQVSMGEWVKREEVDGGYTKYLYKACTCPGSSGAPAIVLGRKWWLYTEHPHCGHCDVTGLNISGFGYDVD